MRMKKTLRQKLSRTRTEARRRRRTRRKQLNDELDSKVLPPDPRFLKLVSIKQLRVLDKGNLPIGAIPYETISYKEWKKAKASRARPRNEEWYVVANPGWPFTPLTRRRVKKYLHGSTWWKR